MSELAIIVAVAGNGVIGQDNRLPWRIPQELRRFRRLTMGKPVLMGRLTHESIGKPLDGRRNLVLSRTANYRAPGCEVFTNPESALAAVVTEPEVMVIGGARLYRDLLAKVGRIYLTEVEGNYEGDAFFPRYAKDEWQTVTADHFPAHGDSPAYRCLLLERTSGRDLAL